MNAREMEIVASHFGVGFPSPLLYYLIHWIDDEGITRTAQAGDLSTLDMYMCWIGRPVSVCIVVPLLTEVPYVP